MTPRGPVLARADLLLMHAEEELARAQHEHWPAPVLASIRSVRNEISRFILDVEKLNGTSADEMRRRAGVRRG